MKYYRQEMVAKKCTDRVVCNICAREIPKDKYGNFYDYIEVKKQWGYLSEFDGQIHCFDICQQCYKNLSEGFAFKPDIE